MLACLASVEAVMHNEPAERSVIAWHRLDGHAAGAVVAFGLVLDEVTVEYCPPLVSAWWPVCQPVVGRVGVVDARRLRRARVTPPR